MSSAYEEFTFGIHQGDHATYRMGPDADLRRAIVEEPFLSVDIETGKAGTDRQWNVKAVSVSTTEKAWVMDPALHATAVRDVMANSRATVFHNAPYDLPIMVQAGLASVDDVARVHDTILLSRLARPSDHGGNDMGTAADRYLGPGYKRAKDGVEDVMKKVLRVRTKGEVFDRLDLSSPAYRMYAGFDTIVTARLYVALPAAVEAHHALHPYGSHRQYGTAKDLIDRETTVMRVLLRRSCKGLELADEAGVASISRQFVEQVDSANALLGSFGIDVDMTDVKVREQVMLTLDAEGALGARWKRTERGMPSGDKKALEHLEHPLAKAWLTRSVASNYLNKFIDQYFQPGPGGRVYPRVSVAAARTGRMSYSSPPLQQIPPEVRPMIRHGRPMTSFDWSSIEPVVWFNATKEHTLVEGFENGGDLYQPIADMAGVTRKAAKIVLLAGMYGQGVARLAGQLGVTEIEAAEIRKSVRGAMPKAFDAIRSLTEICNVHGTIITMYGRNVPIDPDPQYGNKKFKGYQGVNYFVQGSSYDLLADAIVEIEKAGAGDAIVLALHDELVVESDVADITAKVMTTPPQWFCDAVDRTPALRVGRSDLGTTWAAKE